MNKVTEQNAIEVEVHRFVTDASDLQLPVGVWPQTLETNLGNGEPFVKIQLFDGSCVKYLQRYGCVALIVFND